MDFAPDVAGGATTKPGPAGTAADPITIKGALDGKMSLTQPLNVSLTIGKREITMIAEEVVSLIEGKIKAAPARP